MNLYICLGNLNFQLVRALDLFVEDEEDVQDLNLYAVIFPTNNPGTLIKTDSITGTRNPEFNFGGKIKNF